VGEKDLALFVEFAEKQRAGRGEAADNFKFGEVAGGGNDDEIPGGGDGNADDDDLYA
jgi:transitional endoplasmic reticulum ATPase